MTDPIEGAGAPRIHDLEQDSQAARTEPVARAGRPPARGRDRWRWMVAIVVVALVAVTTLAGAALLTGARSASTVARWAPADTLVYGELRPDLPGDQRDALASFLSAFPGFADRSILDQKLTEVYDRLLSSASGGQQTYSADIAPWFGGQLGVAVEAPADLSSGSAATMPPTLLIATTTDGTKALAWVRKTATAAGATVSSDTVDGAPAVRLAEGGQTIVAVAPTGVLLLGPEGIVTTAVRAGGSGGLADNADFQAATTALGKDALGTVYVHVRAYAELLSQLPMPSAMPTPLAEVANLAPAWAAADIRAESDALAVDGAAPQTSLSSAIPDTASQLPARLPASTLALAETHDVGTAISSLFDQLPDGAAQRTQLDQILQPVGGLDGLVGWMGEAGVAVLKIGDQALPGAVAIPTDAEAARTLARNLGNLAAIAGLRSTETSDGGTTITTIDLSKLLGAPSSSASGTSEIRSVSWAITDRIVVVGPGVDYVKAVLDAGSGSTLADVSGFSSLVSRVGAKHRALAWADVAAIRDLVAAALPADQQAHYTSDIEPYLAPLDSVVGVVTGDGGLSGSHGLLVVNRP